MPRIDILGQEAIQKVVQILRHEIEDANILFGFALLGDIGSNPIYCSWLVGKMMNCGPKQL